MSIEKSFERNFQILNLNVLRYEYVIHCGSWLFNLVGEKRISRNNDIKKAKWPKWWRFEQRKYSRIWLAMETCCLIGFASILLYQSRFWSQWFHCMLWARLTFFQMITITSFKRALHCHALLISQYGLRRIYISGSIASNFIRSLMTSQILSMEVRRMKL